MLVHGIFLYLCSDFNNIYAVTDFCMSKKITIKDVARLSGVSKGTVDRVIHGRGEVSEESVRKVNEVIRQIEYKPNVYASLLASKKQYTVICLIPKCESGEYWELVNKGIACAETKATDFNISIEVIFYDQFSNDSFRAACSEVLERTPQAVLLAPMYKKETLALTQELARQNIPHVYIDSRLSDSQYLAYYGMPMYQSGYLAASLLLSSTKPVQYGSTINGNVGEIANFRIDRGASDQDNPTLQRRVGFMDYMGKYNPKVLIYEEFIRPYDHLHNMRVLDNFFEQHPNIDHIITFNSRVHLISEYLEHRGMLDKILIGFDKLPSNMNGLKKGYTKFLITQRTETQVYRSIEAIIDYIIFHKLPAQQDNYMSLDILTKYNMDFYFDIYEQ